MQTLVVINLLKGIGSSFPSHHSIFDFEWFSSMISLFFYFNIVLVIILLHYIPDLCILYSLFSFSLITGAVSQRAIKLADISAYIYMLYKVYLYSIFNNLQSPRPNRYTL